MTERRDTRVVAGVGVILNLDGRREPCMTRNLGRGGLFALTKTGLSEGRELEVEIVHRGRRLTSAARVASLAPDGVGLTFIAPSPDFQEGVQGLIGALMEASGSSSGAPHDHVAARIAWAHLPDGRPWMWWRKRPRPAEIASLTLDGAGLTAKRRPVLGETVLIFLSEQGSEEHSCRAEVARHTSRGFAVKFLSPSMEFRRLVSRLRRGEDEEP